MPMWVAGPVPHPLRFGDEHSIALHLAHENHSYILDFVLFSIFPSWNEIRVLTFSILNSLVSSFDLCIHLPL